MELNRREIILGRNEHEFPEDSIFSALKNSKILITGGQGSIGIAVTEYLKGAGISFSATDIHDLDVTDLNAISNYMLHYKPTHVLHLAADKHAPNSEVNPEKAFTINVLGTSNLIKSARLVNAKIVTASTCKACDPETVYGCTKLIAERITLNANGCVARFYNVIETSENVFRIWESLETEEIPVTPCYRYFITLKEASYLLLLSIIKSDSESGRYSITPGRLQYMPDVAKLLYPARKLKLISPRRGDRIREPLIAQSENFIELDNNLLKINSPYDKFL